MVLGNRVLSKNQLKTLNIYWKGINIKKANNCKNRNLHLWAEATGMNLQKNLFQTHCFHPNCI